MAAGRAPTGQENLKVSPTRNPVRVAAREMLDVAFRLPGTRSLLLRLMARGWVRRLPSLLREPILLHTAEYTRRHPEVFAEMQACFGSPSNEALQAGFWGSDFGYLFLEQSPAAFATKDFYQRIRDTSAEVGAQSFLDVGCGYGVLCCWLKRTFPEATGVGVDIAPSNVEEARRRAARDGLDVRFEQGSFANLLESFAPKSFDAVLSTEAIVYHEDGQQALAAMSQIARKWLFVTAVMGQVGEAEYLTLDGPIRGHDYDRYWVHPLPVYASRIGLPVHSQGRASTNCYFLDIRFGS
jgi:SAM-dependent methyltransferase